MPARFRPLCGFIVGILAKVAPHLTPHLLGQLLTLIRGSITYTVVGEFPEEWVDDPWPLIKMMNGARLIDYERCEVRKPISLPEHFAPGTRPSPLFGWFDDSWTAEHIDEFFIKPSGRQIPFEELVRYLDKRPTEKVAKPIVIFATQEAASEAGGVAPGLSEPGKLWHDLGVAELAVMEFRSSFHALKAIRRYYSLLGEDCGLSAFLAGGDPLGFAHRHWRCEEWLLTKKISVNGYYPDAAIVESGRILVAAEFGGARYDRRRLREIFDPCMTAEVPIYLW